MGTARNGLDDTDAAGDGPDGESGIDSDFLTRLAGYPRRSSAPIEASEPDRPAAWRWPVAVSRGLVGAGYAAVLAAAWLLPDGLAAGVRANHRWPGDDHTWLDDHALRVLAVALGIALALPPLVAWYRRWMVSERSSFRVPGSLLVAVAALTTAWAVAAVRIELSTGLLGPKTVTAGVGAIAVLIGSLPVLIAGRRAGTVGFRRTLLAAAPGAVIVVVAATAAAVGTPGYGLVATVARRADVPAVPPAVSRVAWSRAMPSAVRDVVSAGPGVLVLLEDGLVAVDGRTGRIRWTYRRPGADTLIVSVSPDGTSALLHWGPGETQLVALDANTGRVRYRRRDVDVFQHVPMTNDLWLSTSPGHDRHRRVLDAWSLRDGHHLWRYQPPKGCRLDFSTNVWKQTTADAVVLPLRCHGRDGDSVRFVAYGRSSTPRWHRRTTIPGHSLNVFDVFGYAAADGSWYGADIDLGDGKELTMGFDPRSGRPVPYHRRALSRTRWLEYDGEGGAIVHDASGAAWPVPATHCSLDVATMGGDAARGAIEYFVANGWTFAAGGVGCVDRTGTARGRQIVQAHEFASGRWHRIPVNLGGPYLSSSEPPQSSVVAAPGAWVVWSRDDLADNGVGRLVGLR